MEKLPIASLHPDPANVRKHPEKNIDAIKASLTRFGQQKPIVIDKKNIVRAGNGTLEAARALGWSEIGVVRTDLSGSEATAFAIADNRTAELAIWDDDGLAKQLLALEEEGFKLDQLGFDAVPEEEEKKKKTVSDDGREFLLIVTCVDEEEQRILFQEFSERQLSIRIL